MKVICIKPIEYTLVSWPKIIGKELLQFFEKDKKYELIDYEYADKFYIGHIQAIGPYAMYPLSIKFRDHFITLQQYRKLKLLKIDGSNL